MRVNVIWVFSLVLLALCQQVLSQGWEKTYGHPTTDQFGYHLQQSADGGFILLGDGYNGSNYDGLIIKTDWDGDSLWTYTVGGPFYQISGGLCKLFDGRMLGVFQSNAGDTTVFVKMDTQGNVTSQFKAAQIFTGGSAPNNIVQSSDGNFLLSGINYDGSDYVPYAVKIDSTGNVLWSNFFSGGASGSMSSAIEASNGNYYFCGHNPDPIDGFYQGLLAQIAPNGSVLWQRQYGDTMNFETFSALKETPDSFLILTGSWHNQHGYLIKTNLNGDTIWQKSFPYFYGDEILIAPDGGYIIAGNDYDTLFSSSAVGLIKTDTAGNVLWRKHFGDFFDTELGRDFISLSNGQFAVLGAKRVVSSPYDFYLIKTDTNGNTFTDIISGKIFMDPNQNCYQDVGENSSAGWLVKAQSTDQTRYAFTNNLGDYSLICDTGIYTVTQFIQGYRVPVCPVSPNSHPAPLLNFYDTLSTLDFANKYIPNVQDLQVWMTPLGMPIPGFDFQYKVFYKNFGTDTVTGTLSFIHDPILTWVSSQPAYSANLLNQYDWTFSNLIPDEVRSVTITMHCDSLIPINTLLLSHVSIIPVSNDTVPSDNTDSLWLVVSGSFDPNDKRVTPPGIGPSGIISSSQELEYTVRFQNTGTGPALTVVIRDTLDSDLDLSTFRMLSYSHNYELSIIDNSILKWKFENIQLPDSGSNYWGSMGFVHFAIKPFWFSQIGTVVTNDAAIYFDYNTPVITNTTLNTIGALTSAYSQDSRKSLFIYPNPSNIYFTFVLEPYYLGSVLTLYDIRGTKLMQNRMVNLHYKADLSCFTSGVYLYSLETESGEVIRGKLIKSQ